MTCRRFSAEDVAAFAELTGDRNPIHVDAVAAKKVGLPRAVVHGALLNGLVSGLIAESLPHCVVLRQQLDFPQALAVGDEVTAVLKLVEHRKRFVFVEYTCCDSQNRVVMQGDAKLALMVDK